LARRVDLPRLRYPFEEDSTVAMAWKVWRQELAKR
jgi:hypothetical protein